MDAPAHPYAGEFIDFFKSIDCSKAAKFTPALASEIIVTYISSSKSLHTLSEEHEHWPHFITITNWQLRYPEFGQAMAMAREMREDLLIDQCLEIADDASQDIVNGELNPVAVGRAKVRIETRFKHAAMVCPQKYGARVETYRPPGYFPQDEAIKYLK